MQKKHVAVLLGGFSSERPVSLASGKPCADALEAELAKGDVAAVIIWCNALTKEWAEIVRDKAKAHGALVIYEGRYHPPGTQSDTWLEY